jgi:hypothetical protein
MIFLGNVYLALFRAKNALLTPFSSRIFIDFSLISRSWSDPTTQQTRNELRIEPIRPAGAFDDGE